QVRRALEGLDVTFVQNPTHTDGMGTSVAAGIAAVARTSATAALIALGDMPYVRASTYNELVRAYRVAAPGRVILPMAGDAQTRRPGNPTVWPRALFADLIALTADEGGRSILRRHPERAEWCEVQDPGVLQDVDR
ncbi:MAG: NTP transferase domain-containing protein, partial [Myxococcota bacterium]